MPERDPLGSVGRRLFGVTKSLVWQAVHSLTGTRLQATTEFLDLGLYGGYFEAVAARVAERLPSGFFVVESRPGVVDVEVWCAQYRRVDILRPYHELAVVAPVWFVARAGAPIVGAWVLEMPVTTEEARWTGVNNYGFPKITADISIVDIVDDVRGKRCVVGHRGVHVLTLRVGERPVEAFEQSATLLNVRDDHRVIASGFDLAGERGVGPGGLTLELGHHAIADELRRLGVSDGAARAIYMPRAHAVLHKGIDLGPLAVRVALLSPARPHAPSATDADEAPVAPV